MDLQKMKIKNWKRSFIGHRLMEDNCWADLNS